MKTLIKFANARGLKVAKINFRANGKVQKGFALVKEAELKNCQPEIKEPYKGYELVTIQPVKYSNGDKWLITGTLGLMYAKSISQVVNKITGNIETKNPSNIFSSNKPFLN